LDAKFAKTPKKNSAVSFSSAEAVPRYSLFKPTSLPIFSLQPHDRRGSLAAAYTTQVPGYRKRNGAAPLKGPVRRSLGGRVCACRPPKVLLGRGTRGLGPPAPQPTKQPALATTFSGATRPRLLPASTIPVAEHFFGLLSLSSFKVGLHWPPWLSWRISELR
jgi:hypothetical protein